MTDTIAMAKTAHQNQGSFEMEVTFGDEADLHHQFFNCKKNPGHDKFVPVNEFCLEHLPARYQDPDILAFVKAEADLTVRLYVKCISDKRPDIHPYSQKPYPFIAYRGSKNIGRTGTGYLYHVKTFTEMDSHECECYICDNNGQRKKMWGEVWIETATHVVFDQLECDYTKCNLFYDTSDTKMSDLPSLDRPQCCRVDAGEDLTVMAFKTHDMKLLDRLCRMKKCYLKLHKRMLEKYSDLIHRPILHNTVPDADSGHKLAIIVSHPHGCSKMITVGEWTDRLETDVFDTQYIYNTDTCPGSSGARVYILGKEGLFIVSHLHQGSCETPGLNRSGIGVEESNWLETVDIPASKVHPLLGKERETLKDFKTQLSVDMYVEKSVQETRAATAPACKLVIMGCKVPCKVAKKMVENLLAKIGDSKTDQIVQTNNIFAEDEYISDTEDTTDEKEIIGWYDEIDIPASKVKFVIGRNEERVRELEREANVLIIVPSYYKASSECSKKLKVHGLPANVQKARHMIEDLLTREDCDEGNQTSQTDEQDETVKRAVKRKTTDIVTKVDGRGSKEAKVQHSDRDSS